MAYELEQAGFELGRCDLCGARVLWARNATAEKGSGRIPLDPKAPVFYVERGEPVVARNTKTVAVTADPSTTRFLASHFSTCPAVTKAWKLLQRVRAHLKQTRGAEELRGEIERYLSRGFENGETRGE